ncbi:MAG: hypothetical protein ACLPH3_19125 [Terracidiphilus sp.]
MPIVVVGGSGRNVGKTTLVCGLIKALPEFAWTAVKITSHNHGKPIPIWEETEAGHATDTARYLAAGARRAFLVTAADENIQMEAIQAALDLDSIAIFESNRMVSLLAADLCIGVIGGAGNENKPSFEQFCGRADAFVIAADGDFGSFKPPTSAKLFRLVQFVSISPEMLDWVRARLNLQRLTP